MTTALDIISQGYRESNILGIGVVPDTSQQTEGLLILNQILSSVLGFEVGEGLTEWAIGTVNYNTTDNPNVPGWTAALWVYPKPNTRMMVNVESSQTIYLPNEVSDGARMGLIDVLGNLATYPLTLNGNGRTVEGAEDVTISTDSVERTWMYRSDLGGWVRVTALEVDDGIPYPTDYDAAFTTLFAMRMNPRYGRAITAETASWMERSLRALRARYRQRTPKAAPLGVTISSVQAYSPYARGRGTGRRSGWMG